MYKNITLFAFISTFMLTACGGGGSSTVPTTSTASSSKILTASSVTTVSSSKAAQLSSSVAPASSVVSSAISSVSLGEQNFSSSVIASSRAASSVIAPTPSSVAASSIAVSSIAVASSIPASSSSVASSVKSSSSVASSVKSSSSIASSIASSIPKSSSSIAVSSSSVAFSAVASIYHVRGSFNLWAEGTLMLTTSTANVYELCVNFLPGDDANGGPRFKIDPSGAWGDSVPAADYTVAAGWVKISFNSTTKAITAQQNLQANCGGASSSSVASVVSSSAIASSSSVASSSVKSSSSSLVAPSSSSSAPGSSSSSAASSFGPHYAGEDCAGCHVAGGSAEKKIFTIAGTVYKAANSGAILDLATPVHTAASIVIMDEADSVPAEVIRVQVDANGNFYSYASLGSRALSDLNPRAIGTGGAVKLMSGAPSTGSCNSCHNRTATAKAPPIWVK